MPTEQPKKPVGGAFGIYLAEQREAIKKSLPEGHKITDITKKAGEQWKALGEGEKTKYMTQYEAKAAAFKTNMAAFEAGGGVPLARKSKKAKEGKKAKKDPNAPKRPAGGGYGVYLEEQRETIKKSLPADHKMTDIGKVAGEKWRSLSDAAKKPYEVKSAKKAELYKAAMEEYKKKNPQPTADEPPKKAVKRKAASDAKASTSKAATPPAKKGRGKAAGGEATEDVKLDPAALKEAKGLGYESAFRNLCSRPGMKDIPGDKIVRALKASGGLVNKAKVALLGA